MELYFKKYGTAGQPFIILHGLYGSQDNWLRIAKELAPHFSVYTVDQRNHGRSPHNMHHCYLSMRDDLREFIVKHHIENPIILGHSMGGKTAMMYALTFPGKIDKLIVVDIAPRSYTSFSEYDSHVLLHQSIIQAMLGFDFTRIVSREAADEELGKTIKDQNVRSFLLKNLKRNKSRCIGKSNCYRWQLNIQAISDNIDKIVNGFDEIVRNGIRQCRKPTLFIKGENSNYILDSDTDAIKKLFPEAEIQQIQAATHWLHVEKPEAFLQTVKQFA